MVANKTMCCTGVNSSLYRDPFHPSLSFTGRKAETGISRLQASFCGKWKKKKSTNLNFSSLQY